jgi:uncharacterized RDD family membrane protein YckC
MSTQVPEGWYADPQDPTPGAERWWNGHSWTAHTRERPAPPPTAEAPPTWPGAPGQPGQPQPGLSQPNPAVPPAATVLDDGAALADLGPRLGAYAIDVALVWFVASVGSGIFGLTTAVADELGVPGQGWFTLGFPIRALLLIGLWLGYQLAVLTHGGRSIGKRILGLRVRPVDREGPIDSRTALRRALASGGGVLFTLFPGSQVFGVGLLGFDAYRMQQDRFRRPWHDQVAGTAVVKEGLGPTRP